MLKGQGTILQDAIYALTHKMRGYVGWLQLPSLPVTHWRTLVTISKTGLFRVRRTGHQKGAHLLGYTA